jgi:hypothetical protein
LSPLPFILAVDPFSQILDVAMRHGFLHKLKGHGTIIHASLYVDDATVFLAPIREDIINLAKILESFGEVTGQYTNFPKSNVVPIRCGHINLQEIFQGILKVQRW